jgi:hypothetical protein
VVGQEPEEELGDGLVDRLGLGSGYGGVTVKVGLASGCWRRSVVGRWLCCRMRCFSVRETVCLAHGWDRAVVVRPA